MSKHDASLRPLIRKVEDQGGTVARSKKGHVMFYKDGRLVVVGSGTPSDKRAWLNMIARLRRAGFDV